MANSEKSNLIIVFDYAGFNKYGIFCQKKQVIKELSYQEATERNFTFGESSKPANRRLNRYGDVNPYDHSRIVLRRGNTDYINANLVEVGSLRSCVHYSRNRHKREPLT